MNTKIQIPTATARTFYIELEGDYCNRIVQKSDGTYTIIADHIHDEVIQEYAEAFAYAAELVKKENRKVDEHIIRMNA